MNIHPIDWPGRYRRLSHRLLAEAPHARPLLAGFNIFVDALYPMTADRIRRLHEDAARIAPASDMGPRLAAETLSRVADGRGGALCVNWPEGEAWISALLGAPARLQLGGTGPQAAWALSAIGAPSVTALTNRSDEQLAVLPARTALCAEDGALVPPAAVANRTPPRKPRNVILEFSEGTPTPTGTVRRSTRIMLRFLDSGIERDELFAAAARRMAADAGGLLVSGLDSLPDGDDGSIAWLRALAGDLRTRGLATCHVELAEFPRLAAMRSVTGAFGGVADTLGMSLSELRLLSGSDGPPGEAARGVAERHGYAAVFIHADDWALAVHRGSPGDLEARLMAGNLLASARAFLGRPSPTLALSPEAVFRDAIPPAQALSGGWQVDCVPAPYLKHPRATVGLGDTFVAGLMLAASIPREALARP